MKQLDILARWLENNPITVAVPYRLIREAVQRDLGVDPSNRFFPALLREMGYRRLPTTYGRWYGPVGCQLPDRDTQAREAFGHR